ncbi:MAG: hypothetical protein SNJ81_19360 [Cyanobacteriota bacterium]
MKDITKIRTLGELKRAGYRTRSVKNEIRENLIQKMKDSENPFPNIIGYERTVIPQLQNALLSKTRLEQSTRRGAERNQANRALEVS